MAGRILELVAWWSLVPVAIAAVWVALVIVSELRWRRRRPRPRAQVVDLGAVRELRQRRRGAA